MVLHFCLYPLVVSVVSGSGRDEKPSGGSPPPDSDPFTKDGLTKSRIIGLVGVTSFLRQASFDTADWLTFSDARMMENPQS